MSEYQVIARKFRPQSFKDVIGQDAVVTTLKNALKYKRLAQAYLFCGSRGTGKTTLARLLAKALNCLQPAADCEPCNQCSSCREIAVSHSLDVIEIDGASHRGIEDIRQINENVGYATSSGHYKVYIIDEVHMLTKEAFNALLKTLEEPPAKVKFLFATTEPNKIPSTILSRCQRFNLNRISASQIIHKLTLITNQLKVQIEEDALRLLAQRAEGGLRDAESLLDQVLAFEEGSITAQTVTTAFGLMPREIYFEIDQAGKKGEFARAFEIVHKIYAEGKEPTYFIEGLIDHLRQILLIKVSGTDPSRPPMEQTDREKYVETSYYYSQEQCLDLIEYLLEAQNQLRTTAFNKVSLEIIVLHVMRSHFRIPIEQLVRHLNELEQRVGDKTDSALPPLSQEPSKQKPVAITKTPTTIPVTQPPPPSGRFISEDPTPSPSDLGKKSHKAPAPPVTIQPAPQAKPEMIHTQEDLLRPRHEYDTLLHFAAIELDGKLQKNQM